ncbi:hypothetical protein VNO77_31935 [Canavalia gladiata]|uniref:Uncharacterized protein n=1 Tax=Canavalia gladiata TaxID=3824 RepID=A0AAN9Q7Z2_CANGL
MGKEPRGTNLLVHEVVKTVLEAGKEDAEMSGNGHDACSYLLEDVRGMFSLLFCQIVGTIRHALVRFLIKYVAPAITLLHPKSFPTLNLLFPNSL